MQKKIFSFTISLAIAIRLFLPMFEIGNVQAASEKLECTLQWAISIANDNSHGYSMSNRWGESGLRLFLLCHFGTESYRV